MQGKYERVPLRDTVRKRVVNLFPLRKTNSRRKAKTEKRKSYLLARHVPKLQITSTETTRNNSKGIEAFYSKIYETRMYVVSDIQKMKNDVVRSIPKSKKFQRQKNDISGDQIRIRKSLESTSILDVNALKQQVDISYQNVQRQAIHDILAHGIFFKEIGWFFLSNAAEAQKRFEIKKHKECLQIPLKNTNYAGLHMHSWIQNQVEESLQLCQTVIGTN